jgi:hypothetical protein
MGKEIKDSFSHRKAGERSSGHVPLNLPPKGPQGEGQEQVDK